MSEYGRRLRFEIIGDVTVVDLGDWKILDLDNMVSVKEQVLWLLRQDIPKKILLNFSNVEYLSSAALGVLITLNKALHEGGGRLILCNIDPQIYEVFEITKLDKVFRFEKRDEFLGP